MELKFDEKGLIPAIVQDHYTKEVLTLAYMNAESLAITIDERRTCFWSRSRQELWRKGETSGNVQHVVSITADCDGDALVCLLYTSRWRPTAESLLPPVWKRRRRRPTSSRRSIWSCAWTIPSPS